MIKKQCTVFGLALCVLFAVSSVFSDDAALTDPEARIPGSIFRDRLSTGDEGPMMVVIPAGRFRMGCVSGIHCVDSEKPVHEVSFAKPFALSMYEVTFEDYDKFTYPNQVDDQGWGRGRRPVINVSWDDATEYAAWLSTQTGKRYRLPTEAEWEYAARAGSITMYHFGNSASHLCRYGNYLDASLRRDYLEHDVEKDSCFDGVGEGTAEVGRYEPNSYGLHDMHGNVNEWVEDCWNDNYAGAPGDGSARTSGDCRWRVIRGGSWSDMSWILRSAGRIEDSRSHRFRYIGFRLAQDL